MASVPRSTQAAPDGQCAACVVCVTCGDAVTLARGPWTGLGMADLEGGAGRGGAGDFLRTGVGTGKVGL